jgi:hypothetical protein
MIGLIISRDFQKLPVTFQNDERFGISGFWHLAHVFAVKSDGPKEAEVHTDIMACLVYSGPRDSMWWSLADAESAKTAVQVFKEGETIDQLLGQEICLTCNQSSVTIYMEGWICTNVVCSELGKNHSGQAPPTQTYREQFLEPWISAIQLAQMTPTLLPEHSDQIQLTDDKSKNFKILRDHWRGWVCANCQTMNRRKEYHKLVCGTCGQSFMSSPPRVKLDQVTEKELVSLTADDDPPHRLINATAVQLVQQEFSKEFATYT